MIKVLQVGIGPLGQKIGRYISDRQGIKTISAVDKNPNLVGKDFGELCNGHPSGVVVRSSIADAVSAVKPDVAILSTVSDMKRIEGQIEEIAQYNIPIVSTCEELSYPWDANPEQADKINEVCKKHCIATLGTGVNPGFLMDALPTFLTSVCQDVQYIEVQRYQDAQYRRVPFQKKIGAGLTLKQFEDKRADGTLRHVGLTESMQLIANRMGWQIDEVNDQIEPVIAQADITTTAMTVRKGEALGVMQTGTAYHEGELKIKLEFKAAIGVESSYDQVQIKGNPDIISKIDNGVNGDVATCAIVINAAKQVLRSTPGLKTMGDIPLVSYFS